MVTMLVILDMDLPAECDPQDAQKIDGFYTATSMMFFCFSYSTLQFDIPIL